MKDSDHLGADGGVDSRYLCSRADGFSADIATLAAGWGGTRPCLLSPPLERLFVNGCLILGQPSQFN